jgi:aromatic-L-amino-acid decarboxylase
MAASTEECLFVLDPFISVSMERMSPEEFRSAAHQAVDWIADYLRDIRDLPVLPDVRPGDVTARLPTSAPENGESFDRILNDFRKLIVPGNTHWNHPRFFAYYSTSASAPGILGEMLASALNVNHMIWKTSPAATELEQLTLSWLRQWLGLPETFFGIIHDTASISTMHAVLAAREAVAGEARLTGEYPKLVLYTSEHANLSVDRAALAVGVGLYNIRHIPGDELFRMRPDSLAAAIEEDLEAGNRPFCVVPTLGTTSSASLDPIAAIAKIAHHYGLWLHVDAAYAGPAAVLDEYRHLLDGVEQADSFVLNPHKWLFVPMDLSVLYTRRPEVFRRALSLEEAPAYLTGASQAGVGQERPVNFSEYSVALGRRFRALKLWFVMRSYGREGIACILREQIRMARAFAEMVEAHPAFELSAPPAFSLVCFRLKGSDSQNHELLDRVNKSGHAFLSGTTLHGKYALRLAIGNVAATSDDVEGTWTKIQELAQEISSPEC